MAPVIELFALEGVFNKGQWIDPFPYPFKKDAIDALRCLEDETVDGVLFDPPYSQRQLKEMYSNAGISLSCKMNSGYWSKLKDEISRILKINGKVISFGWNSGGIGKKRGFKKTRIMLINHGAMHNDTICVVEKKIQNNNTLFQNGSNNDRCKKMLQKLKRSGLTRRYKGCNMYPERIRI